LSNNLIKFVRKISSLRLVLFLFFSVIFLFSTPNVFAATSPTLGESAAYSALGASTVTNTGSTTAYGAVGVSAGTAITGFPPGSAGGGLHSNDASAIAAQADNLAVFGTLNQTCDVTYGAQDLTLVSPLGPGVYCSTGAFSISGNLTLTGTGSGVYIFKSVSTLITASNSTVTGGDPCKVWWRVGSSATLGTSSTMLGSIFALTSVSMNTSATLNGRALVQTGAVTMDANTLTGTACVFGTTLSTARSLTPSTTPAVGVCTDSEITTVPTILEATRVSPTSVFLSWGPYAGLTNFIVRYGPTDGNWLYNTSVSGFSATINSLPANQPMWFQVAAKNNCTTGTYGGAVLAATSNNSGPLLPNTGFGQTNSIPWNIALLIGIVALLSASFALALFKHSRG